jgi:TrmH family RNA methyltransferase
MVADAVVRNRSNALLRRLRALKERTGGAEPSLVFVEGPKLLGEALEATEVLEVAASPRAARSAAVVPLLRALEQRRIPLRLVEEKLIASLSELESSQGVLAVARRPSFDEARIFAGSPLVLVAVGIQNPGNMGGLLRTAEAARATGAYLTAGTADPLSWKGLRGSMGSAFRLTHVRGLTAEAVLRRLSERGVVTIATKPGAELRYDEADLRGPVAFLFGNEGAGLPDALVRAADLRVTIPMARSVESLNVGVAAGILLFEAARQRR